MPDSVSLADPLWVIGAAEEPNALFQSIRSVAASTDGTVAVADLLGRVALFDSLGHWIRDLGARGEGPGEYRQPRHLEIIGDSVIVWDTGLRRVSWFSLDGEFLGSDRVQDLGSGLEVRWTGEALFAEVERGQSIDPDPATSVILRVIPDQPGADTLTGPYPVPEYGWKIIDPSTQTGTMVNPPVFSVRPPWDMCFGQLVWGDPVGDSVVILGPGTGQRTVLQLDSRQEAVSEEDIQRYAEASRDRWNLDAETTARIQEETSFAPFRPSFTDLICGAEGEFWLARFDPSALFPADGVAATAQALQ